MSRPPGSLQASSGRANSSKPVPIHLNKIAPEGQGSRLRSLLPKSLLRDTGNPVGPTISLKAIPTSDQSSGNSSSSFPAGEIIVSQPEEVRLLAPCHLDDGGEASTQAELLGDGSPSTHVLALTDAQMHRLLGEAGSQVLHMVTLEGGDIQGQSVDGHLDDQTLSIVGKAAQDVASLTAAQQQAIDSESRTEPVGVTQALSTPSEQETQSVHVTQTKCGATADLEVDPGTLKMPQDDTDKGEVLKKTMVEAFVKMVVCRKVTVQKISPSTGQVLDTQVKLEEEEPVILGVDCVETTEGMASSEPGQEDKHQPFKWGASLDGGLKFLSAVSESRQKIGKNLLADALLKSSRKVSEINRAASAGESAGVWKVGHGGSSGRQEEAGGLSDSDWNGDEDHDQSEDYIPGKEKSATRARHRGRQVKTSHTVPASCKAKVRRSVTDNGILKKRGKKRRWDNALGIASNLRTCQFCSKHFKSPELCAKHMKKGNCVSSVFCFLCSKPVQDEKQLEAHLATHEEKSKSGNYECSDCNRTYRTRAGYVKHFRMGTCLKRDDFEDGEVGDFPCDICSSQFSTEAYLKLHKYKVHENPTDRHTCPDCGKHFYSSQGYHKHRAGRSCTEPLTCKICGKTYSSKAKESFKIHMRHHRSEATGVVFECDQCERTYMTQMALNKHKLSHTGVKPYRCDICGKEFAMRYMVKDHARTHTGERPYPCLLCGSAFSNRGHLGRHMRSHQNGTLLKRGRPKKVRNTEEGVPGLKMIDISNALQQLDRQTIQVVDSQSLDSHVPGAPMIIRTDNNTIIIAESWPASTPVPEVAVEQASDAGADVIATITPVPVASVNS